MRPRARSFLGIGRTKRHLELMIVARADCQGSACTARSEEFENAHQTLVAR